jgi:ABC-type lipoprotein export system ATPase subunit
VNAVEAHDLFFLYRSIAGDVAALRGLSVTVAEGEFVAVLGPSGAGKSTFLQLCGGFARPSSGELSLMEVSTASVSTRELAELRRRSIGIIRQHYHRALPPELSAEEIVGLPLRLLGRWGTAERKHVAWLLDTAGLRHRAEALPAELSGGEQQRVAVCAALAKRPGLLLADEPTGELDPANSSIVIDLLLGLSAETGSAAVVVTHDPDVSARAQRTIHIRDGRLSAEGVSNPALVVDEHGWLRLPGKLREQAGVADRVRARASWGRIELHAEKPARTTALARPVRSPGPGPEAKRYSTEAVLDRVSKRYGTETVFVDLSHTFAPERLHVLAGPSGSGKTSCLDMLAGLERPDAGSVWIGGRPIESLGADELARWRQQTLGYLSQHSTLVEFLTARENVEFGLALRGFGPGETAERAMRWLDWVGLAKLRERRADRLSGGEQRRVALARALAPAPRLLLADEPTAHLDQFSGRAIIRLLQQAVGEVGTTVVAATHDPDLITAADERLELSPLRKAVEAPDPVRGSGTQMSRGGPT